MMKNPVEALPHAIKKTVMLIGFMGLHTEKGGFCVHRELNRKWTVNRAQWTGHSEQEKGGEEVKKDEGTGSGEK